MGRSKEGKPKGMLDINFGLFRGLQAHHTLSIYMAQRHELQVLFEGVVACTNKISCSFSLTQAPQNDPCNHLLQFDSHSSYLDSLL